MIRCMQCSAIDPTVTTTSGPLVYRCIFAKGTFCDNIWLWFRGYRFQETAIGWCMMRRPKC